MALASEYGRYGYRRITAELRDRGWHVGKDRVQRIWRREGLKIPQKQRPRGRLWLGDGSCIRLRPERANHVWSYDFVSAMTHDGRTLRRLTLIDEYTRECLAIRVARRLGRYEVMEALADSQHRGPFRKARIHAGSYCREALSKLQVKCACDLARLPDGQYTCVAGCVIARQRPGTAKGFVFLSLEDETGISNVIVNPDLYEKYRKVINREKFLRVEGVLQNQDHTIFIKASRVFPIAITLAETQSHDFH